MYEEDYCLQGDSSWHTKASIRQRKWLRKHRRMKTCIEQFWWTFRSVRATGALSKEEYIRVLKKMAKALHKNYDEDFCHKLVMGDWKRDKKNKRGT